MSGSCESGLLGSEEESLGLEVEEVARSKDLADIDVDC